MSNPSPRPTQRRKRSAIWIVVGAMGLLALLLAVFAAAVLLRPVASLNVPGADVVELDDGREIFALVTFGTQHEWVGEIPKASAIERFFEPIDSIERSTGTGSEEYVIWLSGVHPVTGKPHDFSWWAYSSVADQYGDEIRDSDPHVDVVHITAHGTSSSGSSGSRPMAPVTEAATVIMVRSELPRFYTTAKNATLRLHDSTGKVMGKVPFMVQHTVPSIAWKPDPLPAIQTSGNTGVTLKNIEFKQRKVDDNGQERIAWHVVPQFEGSWKGKPSRDFGFAHTLSDSLGNSDSGYQSFLSTRTEAWKLHVRVWRTAQFEFEAEEMWQGPMLDLPPSGKQSSLSERGNANGTSVELFAIGGGGSATHDLGASQNGNGSSSSSGNFRGVGGKLIDYQTTIQYKNQKSTLTVDSDAAHLALRLFGNAGRRFVVRVVDDQGREVPALLREKNEVAVLLMSLPDDAKSIQPTFIVYDTAVVDFLIKPPNVPPAETEPNR